MNIAIRVDASIQIGTGHVMRCLTLANRLLEDNHIVVFFCYQLPEPLEVVLREAGVQVCRLNPGSAPIEPEALPHAAWLGTSQQEDAAAMIQAMAGSSWDWVVVDHYALDYRWEKIVGPVAKRLLVIDDLADRNHVCDVLLDQNFNRKGTSRYKGRVGEGCRLLLGPRYALLSPAFKALREKAVPKNGKATRLLVFFGGIDADNHVSKALDALIGMELEGVEAVDVVVGKSCPHLAVIRERCRREGFHLHVQTSRMAELMAAADLAIGAGGTAIWERCCVGLPTLVYATAHNQEGQVAEVAAEGLVVAPDLRSGEPEAWRTHIQGMLDNASLRGHISGRCLKAVDGLGADRVAGFLRGELIQIRKAVLEDSTNIFTWRNHPDIRMVSRNNALISWEDHSSWYAKALVNPNLYLLVGEDPEGQVGVVRFDISQDQVAEVSIYLVPGVSWPGAGSALLARASEWLMRHRPDIHEFHAVVMGGNVKSHRLFQKADYRQKESRYVRKVHKP